MVALGFITNVPAPYKTPRLNALAARDDVDLTVIYANDRTHRHEYTDLVERNFSHETIDSKRIPIPGGEVMIDTTSFRRLLGLDVDAFVVGGWSYLAAWNTLFVSKLRGVPIGVISENIEQNTRLSELLLPKVLSRFDVCFPTGVRAAEHLEDLGIWRTDMTVLPYCVDVADFQARIDDAEAARLRDEYGLTDEFVVLYVGLFEERKGVSDLVTAVGNIDENPPHLLLVGDGPKREALERQAAELGDDQMTFIGEIPNQKLANYYAMADAFVLPSRHDPWGLVLNEAMACGTPVITTTGAGAAGDLVEDGETGLVVPPADPASLTEALIELQQNPALRTSLSSQALERLEAYTPARYAELIANTMIELIE